MTYYKALIETIETEPLVTWNTLESEFGRNRDVLRGALVRKHRNDLVTTVDTNSGFSRPTPYSAMLVKVVEGNPGIGWDHLSRMFAGRSENALRSALYYTERPDLIGRVTK